MAGPAHDAQPDRRPEALPDIGPGLAPTALERRLQQVLDPYRDRLEPFEIYGMPMLRRPGARAHDWFAGVRAGFGAVKFSLLPMHAHPEVLEGASASLLKRKTGASVFMFRDGDDDLVPELERVVARAFLTYWPEDSRG